MTCYIAAGTQSERAHVNNVIVMKMDNMSRNRPAKEEEDDDSSDDDDDSDTNEDAPELETAMIKHVGAVNRIRVKFFIMWASHDNVYVTWPITVDATARGLGLY